MIGEIARTRKSPSLVILISLAATLVCFVLPGHGLLRKSSDTGTVYYVDSRGGNDGNTGTTPDAAYKEWVAALQPGVTLVPIGVLAVNRAQEKGCTYCYGG